MKNLSIVDVEYVQEADTLIFKRLILEEMNNQAFRFLFNSGFFY